MSRLNIFLIVYIYEKGQLYRVIHVITCRINMVSLEVTGKLSTRTHTVEIPFYLRIKVIKSSSIAIHMTLV